MQPNRARVYRVEGVILARRDWGEADRLITLLTPDRGKLRVIAPGARKPSSRKSGHLELFSQGRFVLARGRTFDKITQAETRTYFPHFREELERVSTAYLLAELLDRFLEEEDRNEPLYELLLESLDALDAGDEPALLGRFYELRLFGLSGYQPQLFVCVRCGDELAPVAQFFSIAEGGVVCPSCARGGDRPGARLSLDALKVMRLIQREPWAIVRRLRLDPTVAAELERHLHGYAAYLLERDLRSLRFLDQVRESGTR